MKNKLRYLKYSLLVVSFIVFKNKTEAQTIQVTANPSQSASAVIGTNNYSVSESIYTETEIGVLNFTTPANAIDHIDFNVQTIGANPTVNNFNLYLKEVPAGTETFVAGPYNTTGYTLVFSGSYTPASAGWAGVDLSTVFLRTSGNNLQLLIERLDNVTHTGYVCRTANGNNNDPLINTSRRVNLATAPVPGTTSLNTATAFRPQIRFRHVRPNDAAVAQVYTLGKLPIPFALPHVISTNIANNGTLTLTNLPVTLTITGANTFTDTKTIATLAPGVATTVSFNPVSPTITGNNTITVSLPADDYSNDNSLLVSQEVSGNAFTYSYSTIPSGSVGITGNNTGDIVAKFVTNTAASINQVGVTFASTGQPFKIGIWDKSGNGVPGALLWESDTLLTTAGVFTLPVSPSIPITDTFFVGVKQTTINNVQFAYQNETPIRPGTFFSTFPTGTTTWADFAPGSPFKFMIEPRLTIANDVGIASINNPIATTSIDNCGIVPQVTVSNFGSNNQTTPFNVTFNIKQAGAVVYSDTKPVSLNSGVSQNVYFTPFTGSVTGADTAFCYTSLATDGAANNDTVFNRFTTSNYSYGGGAAVNGNYEFANSTTCASPAAFQPVYNWITQTSNEVNWAANGNDSVLATPITLPFTFTFFGANYTQFWISSNGWISFNNPTALTAAVQRTPVKIPLAGGIENYIAGVLDNLDLTTATYPDAHTYYGGDATQFVITFNHAHLAASPDFITFQIILKADGNIFIQYNDAETTLPVPTAITNTCSAGIENIDGTKGILYRLNGNYGPLFGSPLALQFKPPVTTPVILLSFTAQRNNRINTLAWSTSQEINSRYFGVERSNDGNNYTAIGQVTAAGNSNRTLNYTFTDNTPVKGINYYRLRLVDNDNLSKYSFVRNVRNEGSADVSVYPNPVKNLFNIDIAADKADQGTITITDVSGKIVYTKIIQLAAGLNKLPVNTDKFSAGAYIIKLQLSDDTIIKKINKL